MWFLRRMMMISWTKKKSSEEVLLTAGISREQMKFLGHTIRKSGIERLALCGNSSKERQRKTKANLCRKPEQMGHEYQHRQQ